jgi:hypothetical protein
MSGYIHSATDLKSLTGEQTYPGHIHQEQDRELLKAAALENEPLICFFCNRSIEPDQSINLHHPVYRSRGGVETVPVHEVCHVEYHSRNGDFKAWGRLSAATRAWAFNLKNVRQHPAYEFDRQYYLMLYAG